MTTTPLTPLATALDGVGRLVAALATDQLDLPTPCGDWTVRQLLGHLVGGNRLVTRVLRGEAMPPPGELGRRDPADQLGEDPVAAWEDSATGLLAAFRLPGVLERPHTVPVGALPGTAVLHLRVVETLVHGWDLACATAQPIPFPDELAAAELAFSRDLLGRLPEGRSPFAASRPVDGDAPALDRLVALLGRDPASAQIGGRPS